MSLSDQCRLISEDNSSFFCNQISNFDQICESGGLNCYESTERKCNLYYRALDGTSCGPKKVCRFASCVKEDDLNMDVSFRNRKFLQHSANLHQITCPQGIVLFFFYLNKIK